MSVLKTITLDLFDEDSIDAAIEELNSYAEKIETAAKDIAKGLAEEGYEVAYTILSDHIWDGDTIRSLEVREEKEGTYILYAKSVALLLVEFGSGLHGGGHPWNNKLERPMGPGTYSDGPNGMGQWKNKDGWWFYTDDPRLIRSYSNTNGRPLGHSFGNPPYKPFFTASTKMRESLLRVAKDVFSRL